MKSLKREMWMKYRNIYCAKSWDEKYFIRFNMNFGSKIRNTVRIQLYDRVFLQVWNQVGIEVSDELWRKLK